MISLRGKDRHMFDVIINFIRAGGDRYSPFIHKFCKDKGIKMEELMEYVDAGK